MAVVLPLLLLVLFGIIDFGLLLNRQIMLTQAAREATRSAAVSGSPDGVGGTVERIFGPGNGVSVLDATPCDPAGGFPEASVSLALTYTPVTPLGGIMQYFGGSADGDYTLTATSVQSCAG